LRETAQLREGMPFGDALRTKADIDVAIQARDRPSNTPCHARIHGAAQDHQLTGDEVIDRRCVARETASMSGLRHPINRSTHDDNDMLAPGDRPRVRCWHGGARI
jgi:hypothetical protein